MLMSFARAILFFYICVRAAKKLHSKMLTAVLKVPLRFFDINPSGMFCNWSIIAFIWLPLKESVLPVYLGRIFNRFSKDMGYLDDILPSTFYDYLTVSDSHSVCICTTFSLIISTTQIMLQFISILIVSGVANYWMFLVMALVIVVFGVLRSYYLRTSREIKRLEAVGEYPLIHNIHVVAVYNFCLHCC